MAYKRNKLEEKEYWDIKKSYRLSRVTSPRKSEADTIANIAVRHRRSMHTVVRVATTPNYRRYKLLSLVERQRNPVTTLGKRVNTIEKHLMVVGLMPMEKA